MHNPVIIYNTSPLVETEFLDHPCNLRSKDNLSADSLNCNATYLRTLTFAGMLTQSCPRGAELITLGRTAQCPPRFLWASQRLQSTCSLRCSSRRQSTAPWQSDPKDPSTRRASFAASNSAASSPSVTQDRGHPLKHIPTSTHMRCCTFPPQICVHSQRVSGNTTIAARQI